MKTPDVTKIRKAMEKTLDGKRYEHTEGVAYTAAALAMRYGEDMENALLAGLLHDCAKCMSDEKKLAICKKHNIPVSEVEERNLSLLHAKAGAYLAEEEYHVRDRNILNAIAHHTTGRPGMSTLEKIIFIADYIEPNRKQAPNLVEIRSMAFVDLDKALLRILEDTLQYLQEGPGEIDNMTRDTYDYYIDDHK